MSEAESPSDVAALTVQLLSAYLANNTVPSEDLAGLIRSTKDALTQGADTLVQEEPETFTPAVSARKSLASPDRIISLIDGKPYKTLKRHLVGHGLTPEGYRSRYNLPANYPMVAPAYAEHRRNIAKDTGLGNRKPAVDETSIAEVEEPSGANIEVAGLAEPQAASEGKAETKPSPSTKKSKASAFDEATLDQVAPSVDPDLAPAGERDTSVVEPTQEGVVADPAPPSRKPKATPAKSPKSQPAKSKRNVAIKPVPAFQAASEAPSDAADKQDVQTAPTKSKRRAKLGLFEKTAAKPGEPANGSAAQTSESSSAPQEPAADEVGVSAKTPAKRKSPKRMARAPNSQADEAGNEDGAES
jgi:predicted transcriptional regulator